jgi:putative hydrolase of the HAD superfamily
VIEGHKRPELYHRVVRLIGSPNQAYMIGDQLDRDIAPAKQAGLTTIYFPSGFVPRWTPDEAKIGPDFRVTDFAEAAAIILRGRHSQQMRAVGA